MLLVASNNQGKLVEFRRLLQGLELAAPKELDLNLEVEETGTTFAANARLKATAFAKASGHIALADDSGLEVDALGGEPGVHSARFGGPGLDDMARCRLLLQRLAPFPDPAVRSARFRCCLIAIAPDGRSCSAEGSCQGLIAATPQGDGGFGYDPVFFLPDRGCTMAQIPAAEKNRISHRAAALKALRGPLLDTFPKLRP